MLRAVLTEHLEPGTAVLFPTKTGDRLDHRCFTGPVWARLLQKAGLPYRKSQAMLHTYAVSPLKSGADLRLVRDKMELSTIAITVDLYGQHVHPDCQTRAVEGLDRALNLAPRRHPAPPEGESAG